MAIETANITLDRFANELDRIVRANTNGTVNGAAIVEEALPHFQELLSDMTWLEEKYVEAQPGKTSSFMLAKAPDNAWTIVSTAFWPDYSTGVHDHLVWGMVGVWKGEEYEERYHRVDDRSRPGYAKMEKIGEATNMPGDISVLVPPEEDYHLIHNRLSVPSYSIHIYGGSLDGVLRNSYDLETGEIKEFRSKYNVIC